MTWVPQRSRSEENHSQESPSEDACRRNSQHPYTQLIWKCWAIQVWPESQDMCSKDHDRINYKLLLPKVLDLNGSIVGFSSHHFLPASWSPSPPKMLLLECGLFFSHQESFPSGASSKEPANAGDTGGVGSIPRSGRSPGGGHGTPLPYSCLRNLMVGGAWWVQSRGSQRVGLNWSNFAGTINHWPLISN